MAFWLRAGLVIGAIYYLSPLRLGEVALPGPALPGTARPAPLPASVGEAAGAAFAHLPADVRARVVETAAMEAGRALGTGLRNAAAEAARPASRDTLTMQDRQVPWRGAAERDGR